jgi:hypothetical protein
MDTPILFLIFNRTETSRRVFERIRQVRPEKLYIAGDGPRANVPQDDKACEDTRQTIVDMIDWPCDLKTLFREKNLGCKKAVSSAISWFFEQESEGVILEDDCLPDPSFFPFCAELLEKYRHEPQIQMISGNNFLPEKHGHTPAKSYFFSRCVLIWGWATWRRAWQHYDPEMETWPELKASKNPANLPSRRLSRYWEKQFEISHRGQGTTWDVQWVFACWKQAGCCILPQQNMVENIGEVGVHMKPYDPCINLPANAVHFPLLHPDTHETSPRIDRILMNRIYRNATSTVGFILLYLFRSACSKEKSFWNDLCQTLNTIGTELKTRSRL